MTVGDEYPRVMFTRERHRKGVLYFGPYASAKKVRETLDVLNRVFPYRPCEGPQPGRRSGVPCLDYHIGRCAAPCVGYISRDEYAGGDRQRRRVPVRAACARSSGGSRREMKRAAKEHEFEDAARYRNRLMAVRHLSERQVADRRSMGSADILGIACSGDTANVQLFHLRDGRLSDRHGFYLENAADSSPSDVLWGFALEYYGGQVAIPGQVVVPRSFEDADLLETFLGERRGASVEVRSAQRGEKRRLADLAARNAELALEHDSLMRERTRARRIEALEELREALNLEVLPLRIECFDISNLGESNPVASMVVFEDAVAKKSDYRKFAIRHSGGQDDFAMIAEAVGRRFARMTSVEADDYDRSFATAPNLVVIDGGKGQLGAARRGDGRLRAAARGGDLAGQAGSRRCSCRAARQPILLDRTSAGLQLLQRVRDEAHRFARRVPPPAPRAKASVDSIFDSLPGVGPARRRLLMQRFQTADALVNASRDELESVPGRAGQGRPRRLRRAAPHRLRGTGRGRIASKGA